MSTDFNPATCSKGGEQFTAKDHGQNPTCKGCAFDTRKTTLCNRPKDGTAPCAPDSRPDGRNIIWVRAQEGKKS